MMSRHVVGCIFIKKFRLCFKLSFDGYFLWAGMFLKIIWKVVFKGCSPCKCFCVLEERDYERQDGTLQMRSSHIFFLEKGVQMSLRAWGTAVPALRTAACCCALKCHRSGSKNLI